MRIQTSLMAIAAVLIVAGASKSMAHHAFSTEFDADLEGELEGEVTRVWWANPHIRYIVSARMPDGTIEEWSLQPPGNLPTYRREGWTRESIQVGDVVRATGNLGRDGAKKMYPACITHENGRRFGRCVNAGSVARVTADPNIDYTYQANDYDVDISGFWSNRYRFRTTVDDFEPRPMPLTVESRAIHDAREFGDDHVLRCLPAGLPRIFGSPYPMEIVDAGSHYVMVFLQDNTPRWVWMDGRGEPEDRPLSSMGFPVGHWEDRTLVIETTLLEPGWLDGSGYPMSGGDDTRIVERWEIAEDGLTIDRTMTIHDSLYTEPLVRTRGSQRGDSRELLESAPCDPTQHYIDMLERGRLEDLLLQQ